MAGVYTPGEPLLGPGNLTGNETIPVDTNLPNGLVPATAAILTGYLGLGLGTSVVAAAGASQGTATAIAAGPGTVFVSATASTEGVKLPTPATNARLTIVPNGTIGTKVYAGAAGQSIGTGTTATTAVGPILAGTSWTFIGRSATKWAYTKSA